MLESYEYYKTTRSVCPECRMLIPAKIVFSGDLVYMLKRCKTHGEYQSLLERNRQRYIQSLSISKPALLPLEYTHTVFEGCGYSCGICPEHQQHTCLPVIEITDYCNLSCPVCLVNNKQKQHITVENFSRIIDTLLHAEGTLDLINISGGEPTMHPDLLNIIDTARRKEITNLSISTNGRSFIKNRSLLEGLIERGVFISLQFDGFDGNIYQTIRGEDLLKEKLEILNILEQAGAKVSLVMTVVRGINDHHIGRVVDLLMEKDCIKSLMIQPIVFTNPRFPYNEKNAMTVSDAIQAVCSASSVHILPEDIISLPCSHPSCFSLAYLLKLQDGGFLPLTRIVQAETYLNVIKNRTTPGLDAESFETVKEQIYELWSASGTQPETQKILSTVRNLICELGKCGRNPSSKEVFSIAENNLKSIFIHSFMDQFTFDLARVMKCCNQYPVGSKLVPCCVRNCMNGVA